jgi:hypothetical protein
MHTLQPNPLICALRELLRGWLMKVIEAYRVSVVASKSIDREEESQLLIKRWGCKKSLKSSLLLHLDISGSSDRASIDDG